MYNESVDVARLRLPEPIYAVDALNIVRGVPGNVEDYHSVRCDEVDAQTAGFGRYEE